MVDLLCLDAVKDNVIGRKDLMKGDGAEEFSGTTPSLLVEGGC